MESSRFCLTQNTTATRQQSYIKGKPLCRANLLDRPSPSHWPGIYVPPPTRWARGPHFSLDIHSHHGTHRMLESDGPSREGNP